MADDSSAFSARNPTPIIAVRSSDGVSLVHGPPQHKPLSTFTPDTSSNCKVMGFSVDGSLFAWGNGKEVQVVDVESGKILSTINKTRSLEVTFSPKNSFVALWENYAVRKGDQTSNEPNHNLTVWDVKTGEKAIGWIMKAHDGWAPQWTADESACVRSVNNEIHIYDGSNFSNGIVNKLRIENVKEFKLAPGPGPAKIACFIPGKKGSPASVRMYEGPKYERPTSSKSFYKFDKVGLHWNAQGTAVLVSAQTDVDNTGKSYYGETNLYLLRNDGISSSVLLDKKGPIYDYDWSPNGKEFAVVYGFMPAKAMLFNHNCDTVYDFESGPRSVAKFSPSGDLLVIAGFGALRGSVEIWGMKDKKKLNVLQCPDSTVFAWCPDSRHLLTATTSPRLKVDNGYKVWHYMNGLVHATPVQELLAACWRPVSSDRYDKRPISAKSATAAAKDAAAKPQVYRPPKARGMASSVKLHEDPKPVEEKPLSKTALKNKKKREAKQRAAAARAASGEEPKSTAAAAAVPASTAAAAPSTGSMDKDKKIRNLNKKLRQIEQLKEKQKNGETLQTNQLEKLKCEADLRSEIKKLEESS